MIADLLQTIRQLRDPQAGCPWDKAQTHKSLRKYLLEEAYETLEAIDHADPAELKEELADLLFQVCLHAQIASEAGHFDFAGLSAYLNQKMIERHPHVFGAKATEMNSEEQLATQWEAIKQAQKQKNGADTSPFASIPSSLPSLAKGLKVIKKLEKLEAGQEQASKIENIQSEQELAEHLWQLSLLCRQQGWDSENIFRQYLNDRMQQQATK